MCEAGLVAIMKAITRAGGEARIVGGAVRDALLGKPVHDVDLAVNLVPEQVITALGNAGIKTVPTGIAHGTVTAVADGKGYELTTLRHDIEPDGRHTKVEFTDDWLADAARRDFTFNALYLDGRGRIHDYFGGRADLEDRCVRFIGDPQERIREDVLRILRIFRFFAQICTLDKPSRLDPLSYHACTKLVGLLPTLSAERVGHEIKRLLGAENPYPACALMDQAGVLATILPEAIRLERLKNIIRVEHGHVGPSAIRRLAALTEGQSDGIAKRLRLSRKEGDRLALLADFSSGHCDVRSVKQLRQKLYDHGVEAITEALFLCASDHDVPVAEYLEEIKRWKRPAFPIKGKDLQKIGFKEGPEMGTALKIVESWWRERDFSPDKDDCLKQAICLKNKQEIG